MNRVVGLVALGGMVGAAGRYGLEQAWPPREGALPWTTLTANACGCALIGALMVLVVETGVTRPLLRPFLGVGVLGGFTTFSTYAVQVRLLATAEPGLALGYLAGTVVAALLSVAAGVVGTRVLIRLAATLRRRP